MNNNLTLAITSIGDLLLNRRITKSGSGKAINNVDLAIPDYQRPYKWTARNAIQLLDDIIEAKNSNKEVYRVGTLILHREVKEDKAVYNIVDGQQRTITFALLLKALFEVETNPTDIPAIPLLQKEVFANQFSRRNIPNNYNAFRRRICKKSEDNYANNDHTRDMNMLRDYIVRQCELIVVITDDISEAFQFFDSQNARGKALYPHDLLKAYHLREMQDVDAVKTEQIVKNWEKIPQSRLAEFFENYLYRIKEWIKGNRAYKLDEHNIFMFKGITKGARSPYAQFYKSAYSYANMINNSAMPFVTGTREITAFQLNSPIIAGKPFFDYTKHYYEILKDIRDNSKYEGFYINDNIIVKTLDKYYCSGKGNRIARLLFDSALLLYVDRFCPATFPTKVDLELFDQFVEYAFVWAYSLRAQYYSLRWSSAQNYILGLDKSLINSFNIYKLIADSDNPVSLLSGLADSLNPLDRKSVAHNIFRHKDEPQNIDYNKDNGIYRNYLHFFKVNSYYNE